MVCINLEHTGGIISCIEWFLFTNFVRCNKLNKIYIFEGEPNSSLDLMVHSCCTWTSEFLSSGLEVSTSWRCSNSCHLSLQFVHRPPFPSISHPTAASWSLLTNRRAGGQGIGWQWQVQTTPCIRLRSSPCCPALHAHPTRSRSKVREKCVTMQPWCERFLNRPF